MATNLINESQLIGLKDKQSIGGGSFGGVYSAEMKQKDGKMKPVAVKVFEYNIGNDEKEVEKYKKEVKIIKTLNHKNVVIFYGETEFEGKNAFAMEKASYSLEKVIHDKENKYSFEEALRWMLDVAEGIVYMHKKNIIHRDLKSANLLVFDKQSPIVKIADFGISREKAATNKTMTACVGTISYSAPEVVRGEKYNRRCDVYSFGVILWEVFSRQKPFAGWPIEQIMYAVGNWKRPEGPLIVNCSPEIPELIEKCWEEDYLVKRMEMNDVLTTLKIMQFKIDGEFRSGSLDLRNERVNKIMDYWKWLNEIALASDSQQNLVDNLKEKKWINNRQIEQVLRRVDFGSTLLLDKITTGNQFISRVLAWTSASCSVGGRCLFYDRIGYPMLAYCLALMVGPEGRVFVDFDAIGKSQLIAGINAGVFDGIFERFVPTNDFDKQSQCSNLDLIVEICSDTSSDIDWPVMLKLNGKLIRYRNGAWLGEKQADCTIRQMEIDLLS